MQWGLKDNIQAYIKAFTKWRILPNAKKTTNGKIRSLQDLKFESCSFIEIIAIELIINAKKTFTHTITKGRFYGNIPFLRSVLKVSWHVEKEKQKKTYRIIQQVTHKSYWQVALWIMSLSWWYILTSQEYHITWFTHLSCLCFSSTNSEQSFKSTLFKCFKNCNAISLF